MTKDIKVGLTVFIALAVFFAGLGYLKGWSLSQEHTIVIARFDDTIGLIEGDPVYIRGMHVGKVEEMKNEGAFVAVKMSVDRSSPVYTDAIAKIGMLELLAGKKIDLIPGISGIQVESGGVIQGGIGADIPRMLSQVNEVSDDLKLLIRNLNKTLEGVNSIVANDQFQQNTLTLMENLSETSRNLTLLTRNLNREGGALDSMAARINRLVFSLNSAVGKLTPQAGQMLSETSKTMENLNLAVTQLNELAGKLNSNKSLANQLLTDEKFAAKFNSTIDSLNLFMNHVRTRPVRLDIDLW